MLYAAAHDTLQKQPIVLNSPVAPSYEIGTPTGCVSKGAQSPRTRRRRRGWVHRACVVLEGQVRVAVFGVALDGLFASSPDDAMAA